MPKNYKLSFQLYTSRNFPPPEAVLEGLAEIGYDGVEAFLPNYSEDPRGFRRDIDAAGLICTGFHMPFTGLEQEPDHFIEIAHTIGDDPLVIPPFLPMERRPSDVDGWKRIGERLARGAERVKASGLRLAWHNHEYEYRLLPDGTRPIDHMLGASDLIGLEVDFAWVCRGWADPVAELEKFAPATLAIQLKDTAPPGTLDDENGWRATGDGVIDWNRLWPLFETTPADHLVVEHDRPLDWRRVAQRSYDFAKAKMQEAWESGQAARARAETR